MSFHDWYKVEQLPWPADWEALFGRTAPLVVEIGFGSGLFLADLARRQSDLNLLGLEISTPSIRNAEHKIRRGGLSNVILMQATAQAALQMLCQSETVAGVIINYPDPWPKKDHLDRRLIDDAFLRLLATRMLPWADLDIATDHDDYAGQIADCLSRSPYFISRHGAAVFVYDDPGRLRTKYEQIALEEGRTPRYFKWRRNDMSVDDHFPILQELPMPHVVLRLPAELADIGRLIQPAAIELEATRIRYIEVYQSLYDGKLMIETYINEDPIRQRLALEIRARPTGEIVISVAEVGFPRSTPGVHRAIGHLVERLRQEYPSLVVIQTTLEGEHADYRH